MPISREEKFAALQEAQRILQLEKKWRRMVPDERKPDFKRAARVIMQRALGHETVGKEPALQVHSGLMHEHPEREARLIERTLRNGVVPPQVLSSFRDGARTRPGKSYIQAIIGSRTPVPAGEPYIDTSMLDTDIRDLGEMVHAVHYPNEEFEFPTHMNTRTGEYMGKHQDHPSFIQLDPLDQPPEDPMRDRVEVPTK
jgi:hypothetical protein